MIKLPLQVQYEKMSALIVEAHEGQKYGNRPYTYHLRMVEGKAYELFKGSLGLAEILRLQIVALGHDLIEDTEETEQSLIKKGFDIDIVNAIKLMSKVDGQNYNQYLQQCVEDDLAFYGKLANTYCNLTESMKDGNFKRTRKYSLQIEKLYKKRKDMIDD